MQISITGTGAVTCGFTSVDALWNAALDGRSGIVDGMGHVSDSHSTRLALHSVNEAFNEAGWNGLNEDDGLILATTTGQVPLWDKTLIQYLNGNASRETLNAALSHQPLGSLLQEICTALDFRGQTQLISTACSASTQALALGAMWIKQGRVKRCLVGGVEILCDLTVQGFKSLQLLSTVPTKPFDTNRQGINLSEGSAFICLENTNAHALAQLSGYGLSTDGYHMTSPHPQGDGCYRAMSLALKTAKLTPQDISWIHAHGTGSRHNDLAEGTAIQQLFGSDAAPWTTSTKWVHGHALGASGAIETALCVRALQNQTILATGGLQSPDPAIALKHPKQSFSHSIKHIMKNTLGFGGANAAIILSAPSGATH